MGAEFKMAKLNPFYEQSLDPNRDQQYDILDSVLIMKLKPDPIFASSPVQLRLVPIYQGEYLESENHSSQYRFEQPNFCRRAALRNMRLLVEHTNDCFRKLY